MDNSCTKCSTGCIQTTGNYRCALRKSTFCRCLCSDTANHMVTVTDLRKKSHWNSQKFTHFLIPAGFFHVEAVKPVSLRYILRDHTCQFICDIAVRLKNLVDLCIYLWKIFLIPEDLRGRIRRLKRISCHLKNLLCTNLLIQSVTDRLCSGIHPDWCICQYFSLFINRNRRPALPIDSNSRDLIRLNICFLYCFFRCPADSIPPFFRILFRPSFLRIIYRIVTTGCCKNFSVSVKHSHLTCACSDINSQ